MFAISLVELAALLGKWLFIAAAPVLLIATAFYYKTGKSYIEPLVGLALVSGIFAGTQRFSVNLKNFQHHEASDASKGVKDSVESVCNEAGYCIQNRESESRQHSIAEEENRRSDQRQAELWRQANPWGGFTPYD